jgi:hypothetical protein
MKSKSVLYCAKRIYALIFFLLGLQVLYSQPMSGNYTIGGSNPDFNTFQQAANALKVNGISGAVTFNIRPGIYMKDNGATSVMILDSLVTGTSPVNRITFQPDQASGGNVNNVILRCDFNSPSNDNQILKVALDYITIQNLTLRDADSLDVPASYLMRVEGVANVNNIIEGLIVEGCRFIGSPYYTQGQQYGTVYGIYSEYLGTGILSNNHFTNLNRGVGLDAETGGVGADSINVENSKFEHLYLGHTGAGDPIGVAIEVEFPHVYIKGNFVSNSSGARGIYIVYPADGKIESNYVQGAFKGEMDLGLNSAAQDRTDSLQVFNNVLIGSGEFATLEVRTRNTKIFHNTIINTGGNNGLWITGHDCRVINNVLKSSENTIVAYNMAGANGIVSDHNLFFKNPGWYFAQDVTGNLHTTFEFYSSITGLDTNSTFKDVEFDFDSLGIHLDECQAQDDALDGIHLPEVPVDFYGARRDSVKPFIGAVEGVRLPYDMYGEPFRTALTGFPLCVATGDFDHSNSIGIVVPDWDNSQILLFHNNGASRTFTQSGTVSTSLQPSLVKLYDLDEDGNLDLIVSGSTNAVEIFWGDGNGNFSNSDIVSTLGNVRSLEPGPNIENFSTIITTEDGFQPSTSLVGYIMNSSGRDLCYDVQRTGPNNDIDTIQAVLTDFVLADLGAGENMPAIVAPGLFGTTSLIPYLFSFDIEAESGWGICQNTNSFFHSVDHQNSFPVSGYYTNSSSIIAGDFDGDLDPDFITTGFNDNYCVLIKNNGNFTFSADTIPTAATRGLAALDYENDGDLDFVAINDALDSLGITVFLNDGVGNFEEKRNCFLPFASGHPNGIIAADFDQDGNTDIAIVSRTPFGGDSLFVLYNLGGFNQTTGVEINNLSNETPDKFELSQNYPNPFNPSTKINFELPTESNVKIFVYNILGQKVRELVNSQMSSGVHTIDFDASSLASGIYIYTIEAKTISGEGNFITAKKMLLLK